MIYIYTTDWKKLLISIYQNVFEMSFDIIHKCLIFQNIYKQKYYGRAAQ